MRFNRPIRADTTKSALSNWLYLCWKNLLWKEAENEEQAILRMPRYSGATAEHWASKPTRRASEEAGLENVDVHDVETGSGTT